VNIRLAAYLQPDSIVDGEGIRTVIWTQGCPHNCYGCHNPETHDYKGGKLVNIEEIFNTIDSLEGQNGLTFSGGDPFVQSKECAVIAKYAKHRGFNIWAYTGYLYEDLIKLSNNNRDIMSFLKEIDVLVDGKFEIDKRSYSCIFRGSSNQRIIDVKKSLKIGKAVLINKYDEDVKSRSYTKQEGVYI